MKNFNLRLEIKAQQHRLDVLCQPIVKRGERHICIDFESGNDNSDMEMFFKVRELLQKNGYEENFSQDDSRYTITTKFKTFERLILFLWVKGFVCRDNYGRNLMEMEAVNGECD